MTKITINGEQHYYTREGMAVIRPLAGDRYEVEESYKKEDTVSGYKVIAKWHPRGSFDSQDAAEAKVAELSK